MFEPPPLPPDWKLNSSRGITWWHYEKDGHRYPVLQRAMANRDEWRVLSTCDMPNKVYNPDWDNGSKPWAEAKVDLVAALITYGFST